MSDGRAAIDVHHLSVVLDQRTIVDDINFKVPTGQTTALIGPNGAGKSVLVKALLGLIPKERGDVAFFGLDSRNTQRALANVSYIPQSISLDTAFPLTVTELFTLKSAHRFGSSPAEIKRRQQLLSFVGMTDFQQARLNTLSGGQLQRVLIAYSLMNEPKLLILDEPSAGIDVQGQENIYDLLEKLQKEEGITLLLVSHELDIVMRYAEQVLCLNKKLLCDGAPRAVLSPDVLSSMYGDSIGYYTHSDESHDH